MRGRKTTTGWKQKSYIIAAVIMLAAAFGMTGVYYSQQTKKQEAKLAKEQELLEKQEVAKEKQETQKKEQQAKLEEEAKQQTEAVSGIIQPQSNAQNSDFLDTPETVVEKEPVMQEVEPHFDAENIGWPLQGNVIMNYSMDQTVYFATLDQYKYNPAVIIQAEVNTPVEAVAAGKVTAVENNAETGATVTIDMGDGYSAVYGQLKEITFQTGDKVTEGDVIGYVSEPTKYFSVEGANLYFALQKDGAPINPMEYLE